MPNTPICPEENVLTRLRRYNIDVWAGKVFNSTGEVGNIGSDGYYRLSITKAPGKQQTIRRCHIIFWAFHERWPEEELDHFDRNNLNDCVSNLREASRIVNAGNRDFDDKALPLGVHFKPRMKTNPYEARIVSDGVTYYVGYYPSPELAHQAYILKREELTK
jgi:hypothetical protein